jgi:Arc/MetJ-type ribon-helix-helix transcriptional regulator
LAIIEEGHYGSSSEYMRDLIYRDRRCKAEQRLADLVREGLESPIEPDDPAFWRKRHANLRRTIAKRHL